MPSGGASRRSRPALPIGRLATTSLRRLRSRTVLRSGGGRLTRLVEHAPPWATCQAEMARSTAEEARADAERYVLIQTEVGKVARAAQALRDLDGVQVAEDITGPYDIIATVQASGLDQLGRLVASRIQAVDGVTRTLTCTVIHR
jgi:DNA-binding Lrp family transcriptional regulator